MNTTRTRTLRENDSHEYVYTVIHEHVLHKKPETRRAIRLVGQDISRHRDRARKDDFKTTSPAYIYCVEVWLRDS
jgi:hypothetical protein